MSVATEFMVDLRKPKTVSTEQMKSVVLGLRVPTRLVRRSVFGYQIVLDCV